MPRPHTHDPQAQPAPQWRAIKPMQSNRHASVPACVKAATPAEPKSLRRLRSLEGVSKTKSTISHVTVLDARRKALSERVRFEKPLETSLCQVCFEQVPAHEAARLSACGHRYCESCIKRYLELKIVEGNVFPVCFHPIDSTSRSDARTQLATTTCGERIEDTQLQEIVDPKVWAKCTLFRFNKVNATARECPFCFHSQDCTNGPENPECTCEKCDRVFCFLHGNAHVNGTCADYELKHAESETQSRATIARVAKPCPGCRSNVEKSGGCNHMTCAVCRTEFCWICGERLERGEVTDHYSATNLGRCGGRQFDRVELDGRWSLWAQYCQLHTAPYRLGRNLYRAVKILAYPAAVVFALLIVGVTKMCRTQTIARLRFSDLVASARFMIAMGTTTGAIVAIYSRLPPQVRFLIKLMYQVRVLGEVGIVVWPQLQRNLRWVGPWIRLGGAIALKRYW